MGKKGNRSDTQEQLSLFEIKVDLPSEESENLEEDLSDDDDSLNFESSDRTIEPEARELLTLKLLREAILDLEVFEKSFAGDRARLAGRQLNLIRDTCLLLPIRD